jgi:hypothetical protein
MDRRTFFKITGLSALLTAVGLKTIEVEPLKGLPSLVAESGTYSVRITRINPRGLQIPIQLSQSKRD